MASCSAPTFRGCHVAAARRPRPAIRPCAARPLRARRLVCRAEHSDAESQQDFNALAKLVAGRLASELGGQEDMFNKLQSWLGGAASESESADEGGASMSGGEDKPKGSGASGGGGGDESTLGRAARLAAGYLGGGSGKQGPQKEGTASKLAHMAADYIGSADNKGPRTDQASTRGADSSKLAKLAADYLGVDSFTIDSVKHWLTNPSSSEDRDDAKMVGALVHRLLQSFESHTGESFEGREQQYEWLYMKARALLGSSMTKSLLKGLVKSYLGLPMR